MTRKKTTIKMFCSVLVSLVLMAAAQQALAIGISSISGYSDGVGVVNGKWTGQGAGCNYAKGLTPTFLPKAQCVSSRFFNCLIIITLSVSYTV